MTSYISITPFVFVSEANIPLYMPWETESMWQHNIKDSCFITLDNNIALWLNVRYMFQMPCNVLLNTDEPIMAL